MATPEVVSSPDNEESQFVVVEKNANLTPKATEETSSALINQSKKKKKKGSKKKITQQENSVESKNGPTAPEVNSKLATNQIVAKAIVNQPFQKHHYKKDLQKKKDQYKKPMGKLPLKKIGTLLCDLQVIVGDIVTKASVDAKNVKEEIDQLYQQFNAKIDMAAKDLNLNDQLNIQLDKTRQPKTSTVLQNVPKSGRHQDNNEKSFDKLVENIGRTHRKGPLGFSTNYYIENFQHHKIYDQRSRYDMCRHPSHSYTRYDKKQDFSGDQFRFNFPHSQYKQLPWSNNHSRHYNAHYPRKQFVQSYNHFNANYNHLNTNAFQPQNITISPSYESQLTARIADSGYRSEYPQIRLSQ